MIPRLLRFYNGSCLKRGRSATDTRRAGYRKLVRLRWVQRVRTRKVAQNHVIRLRRVLGELALAQGWATKEELEQMAAALQTWGESPDAFYARPVFGAVGWV